MSKIEKEKVRKASNLLDERGGKALSCLLALVDRLLLLLLPTHSSRAHLTPRFRNLGPSFPNFRDFGGH